jgi:hypothetical protein
MSLICRLLVCMLLALPLGCGGDKGKNKDKDVPKSPDVEAKK